VDELYKEVIDRFGAPTIQVKWLYIVAWVRTECSKYGIRLLKLKNTTLSIESDQKLLNFLAPSINTPDNFKNFVLQKLQAFIKN
jgi:transcription-repair coupling factor (superfamily II helicase)